MNIVIFVYWLCLIILTIFSYGFIDLNLQLSTSSLFTVLQTPLSYLVFHLRPVATGIYFSLLLVLFFAYDKFLRNPDKYFPTWKKFLWFIAGTSLLLAISFPALTYDLFNYITTAKVAFTYQENPYIVMPIEIPNEPYLAFTRASNKLALYGPVWILLTAVPHMLGGGEIWGTIIAFKLINALALLLFSVVIYRVTKSMKNVVFFALNPLVLIETLVSGHNDIYMMLFAIVGLILWRRGDTGNKLAGFTAIMASWLVKGATLVLLPLLFMKKYTLEQTLVFFYWLMAGVFFVFAPLREELYPWYAIWMISIVSFLPIARYKRMYEFTIILSFALELRHLPYMYMGYYGGLGPLLRISLTVLPLAGYALWLVVTKRVILWNIKRRL